MEGATSSISFALGSTPISRALIRRGRSPFLAAVIYKKNFKKNHTRKITGPANHFISTLYFKLGMKFTMRFGESKDIVTILSTKNSHVMAPAELVCGDSAGDIHLTLCFTPKEILHVLSHA